MDRDETATSPAAATRSPTVCKICRHRKIKCDRVRPNCGFCGSNDFPCEYVSSSRKPGVRAGYVTELEKRIASIERQFESFKTDRDDERHELLRQLQSQRSQSTQQAAHITTDYQSLNTFLLPVLNEHQDQGVQALPQEIYTQGCDLWFSCYQTWFPILHKPSVANWLSELDQSTDSPKLVLKALVALALPQLGIYDSDDVSNTRKVIQRDILVSAFELLSFHGLQAMLILSICRLGQGDMPEFWNTVALCQRMSLQLGLRDLVVNFCTNYGQTSTLPPRMLHMPDTVGCEERIRAFWAINVLDSASTIGSACNLQVATGELSGLHPQDDDIWHLPEGTINLFPFGSSETPSAFSLFVRLVNQELCQVHAFLQQSCDLSDSIILAQRRSGCSALEERLCRFRSEIQLLAAATPPGDLFSLNESPTQNPNVILTYCTLDSSIIALYQRLAFPINGTEVVWTYAADRCLACCDNIAELFRTIPEDELERLSPLAIIPLFVAARFYIVQAKLLCKPLPSKVDLLQYFLKCMSVRWRFASRLGKAIRGGVDKMTVAENEGYAGFPEQFYDLQYVWSDIDHALKSWAET